MMRVAASLALLPAAFSQVCSRPPPPSALSSPTRTLCVSGYAQVMDGFCPPAPGSAVGTVNIGEASAHASGDCTQHSWGHCDEVFDSPACDPENIYAPDEDFVGIAYHQQSSMPSWDNVYVSSCMELGFGSAILADGIHIMGAASDENVCGTNCVGQYCGTSGAMHIFTSSEDSPTMPPYTSFTKVATISMPVDTAATQGDGIHHDTYNEVVPFGQRVVKWAAFCRSGAGGARDHLLLDYVELKPVDGEGCGAPAPSGGPACDADLNGDLEVNVEDLLGLLSSFGQNADGDINGNGVTNVEDLLLLLASFGQTCVPTRG